MNIRPLEELYFHRLNEELLEAIRARVEKSDPRCPRCLGRMSAAIMNGVGFVQCEECRGVYLAEEQFHNLLNGQRTPTPLDELSSLWSLDYHWTPMI
ncbi:MAG: zf-TFIIB domain-containing protein [Bdellovibrionales bacterium]